MKHNMSLRGGQRPTWCPSEARKYPWGAISSIDRDCHVAALLAMTRKFYQNAQLPFRKMATTLPSAQVASMFMESQPIMKSS